LGDCDLTRVGGYVGLVSLVLGLVFIVFGVVQLFGLSDFLLKLRVSQMAQFRRDGSVNHSEDWTAVGRHSKDIKNLREFVILNRQDHITLREEFEASSLSRSSSTTSK